MTGAVSTSEAPSVSVVMPAFNAEEYIVGQLAAIVAQEWSGGIELIVADNGSSDATARLAADAGAHVVDASHRRGPGAARNAGAAVAGGAVLVFVDADDLIDPGYVAAMVAALADADVVGSRVDQQLLNPGWSSDVRTIAQHDALPEFNPGRPWIYGATLAMRRETFAAVGGFDESLEASEDFDFSIRCHLMGLRFAFVPDAVVHCRLRTDLRSVFRQGLYYGKGGGQIDLKYRREGAPYPNIETSKRAMPRVFLASLWRLLIARGTAARGSALFLVGRRLGTIGTWLRRK